MGERFYRQQIEAIGSCPGDPNPTRRRKYAEKMARMNKKSKADYIDELYKLVAPSTDDPEAEVKRELGKLTIKGLKYLIGAFT